MMKLALLQLLICGLLVQSKLLPDFFEDESYPKFTATLCLAIIIHDYPYLLFLVYANMAWYFELSPLLHYAVQAVVAVACVKIALRFATARAPATFTVAPPIISGSPPPLTADEKQRKMPLVVASRPNKIQCWSPVDGKYLGEVDIMSEDEVKQAVIRARAAQLEWQRTTFGQRIHLLNTLQAWILEHQHAIAEACCADSGKLKVDAIIGEIMPTCEKIAWVVRDGEAALADDARKTGPGLSTLCKRGWVQYRPVGVLGVIAPWNYPFTNFMNHIISGLFSGNAVVVKPSEFTSWSGKYFTDIVREALKVTGVGSPDLVQLVTGLGPTGAALVSSSAVDKIIFTGSAKVGKLVMRGASSALTPVVLELGGKDPAVVCNDANLARVVPILLRGSFQNSGQNCAGIERIFAEPEAHEQILKQAAPLVAAMRLGVDYGAVTTPEQLELIQDLVQDARDKGARILAGGAIAQDHSGLYFQPTLIAGVTSEMRIMHEEVFGPVMVVMRFEDEEDMLKALNASSFGLGCSAFSGDSARAKRLVARINAGFGNINDFGLNYMMQSLPFGGIKQSGFGRFAGVEGLRACCYAKAVTDDRTPFIQTWLPRPLQYPIQDVSEGFGLALIRLMYAQSPWAFVKAVCALMCLKSSSKK